MRNTNRSGAKCAIVGTALFLIGTYLHLMGAEANDTAAAFAEYAASRLWGLSHLLQLSGVVGIVAALLFLAEDLQARRGAGVARIAAVGAIASSALAAALQAVDGIALKRMVDAWAAAPAPRKDALFHAAFAVRQIEIGLASMLSLCLGLTATAFGVALRGDDPYPRWIAGLAVAGGAATMLGGLVIAYTGFSGLAMAINMPGNLLLLWMLALGGFMWRRSKAGRGESEV